MRKAFRASLQSKAAFTLVELLVVITIINLLSSVIFVSAASARRNQRMVKRATDLLEMRKALEIYNLRNNGVYPSTCITGGPTTQCTPSQSAWWSECTGGGFVPQPPNQWIPLLVTQGYIKALPVDPFINSAAGTSCFTYKSTGTDYKVMLYQIQDNPVMATSDYAKQLQLYDPRRDGGSNQCAIDGAAPYAWSVYTEGTVKTPSSCTFW